MNEADTCRKFVVPKLQAAGWDDRPHAINEQRTFTDGRVVFIGGKARRGKQKRSDYLLRYNPDFPIAVVEAKARYSHAAEGLQQAKEYAEILGLRFAYSTNGIEIVEFDYTTGVERIIGDFPAPDDLWARLRRAEGIVDDQVAERLLTPTFPDRANPPFGGEEEAGILNNFPEDRRTAETALLFLQLIMRRLKRAGRGRAAVVVPHGTLFGDGISARIKADLLEKFNLHTVVRLREGVFAPYTDIPANLIFFDTSGPTKDIWYYEMPPPEGRKKYSKTAPMAYEEFAGCLAWWNQREEDERAWKVSAADLIQRDAQKRVIACNLDIKNPHSGEVADHRAPSEIVDAIIAQEQRILGIMDEIKAVLAERV